jgi:hypothetical protein
MRGILQVVTYVVLVAEFSYPVVPGAYQKKILRKYRIALECERSLVNKGIRSRIMYARVRIVKIPGSLGIQEIKISVW